jgi:hypothetical protein
VESLSASEFMVSKFLWLVGFSFLASAMFTVTRAHSVSADHASLSRTQP